MKLSLAIPALLPLLVAATARAETTQADATPPLTSALRFRNAEVVTAVDDRAPIAKPASRGFARTAYFFDAYLGRRVVRSLEGSPARRAGNVNALDEIPDSSWFQSRAGVRRLDPQELRHPDVPAPRPPFAVVGTKVGGVTPGMRIKDAAGVGYLLKFDRPDDPDSETAADIVVQRLLWAVGYHTPVDRIVRFRREDLQLDPRARLKDKLGVDRPMTDADLQAVLARVGRRPDGSYRGLASRLLAGVPLGGYPQEGVRPDDPSDLVPHQERRELRGARVFFGWLNHVDIKEDNALDTFVEDPATPGRGHVRHHLVDFGNSLGIFEWKQDPTLGFVNNLDVAHGARALVSFGARPNPWDGLVSSPLPGVGNLESRRFDPARWRPRYPWAPFERFDRFDGLWAAKILMRLDRRHIATAVAEAQYQDPRSAATVTRILLERQWKAGRHFLAQASALDNFQVERAAPDSERPGNTRSLCFDDLLVQHFGHYDLRLQSSTHHRLRAYDFAGRALPWKAEHPRLDRPCVTALPRPTGPADHDGYTIVEIETTRADTTPQTILVHIADHPQTGAPRVIGLRRL